MDEGKHTAGLTDALGSSYTCKGHTAGSLLLSVYLFTSSFTLFTRRRHPRCGLPTPLHKAHSSSRHCQIRPDRHPAGRRSRSVTATAIAVVAGRSSTCRTWGPSPSVGSWRRTLP